MARDPRPSLADAMYPNLSRDVKRKEAAEAWAQEWARKEQKESNARMVERLRAMNERIREEKR
jgi:hypothetical protein